MVKNSISINQDAEGRLVLSDGVVFANKDLHADIIVDMCTLTGAQVWEEMHVACIYFKSDSALSQMMNVLPIEAKEYDPIKDYITYLLLQKDSM